jgi:hypothetical protein
MTQAEAIAKMQNRQPRPQGVYRVDGGWKHSKNSNAVFDDRITAETDYRFSCDWERKA